MITEGRGEEEKITGATTVKAAEESREWMNKIQESCLRHPFNEGPGTLIAGSVVSRQSSETASVTENHLTSPLPTADRGRSIKT